MSYGYKLARADKRHELVMTNIETWRMGRRRARRYARSEIRDMESSSSWVRMASNFFPDEGPDYPDEEAF